MNRQLGGGWCKSIATPDIPNAAGHEGADPTIEAPKIDTGQAAGTIDQASPASVAFST
jgi:hypothetical protein